MNNDLFGAAPKGGKAAPGHDAYSAKDIEVLEGLEPVRRRPGMYVGGTDENALHHLAAEILDNAMDEAVAGHASRIEVLLEEGNRLTIVDNSVDEVINGYADRIEVTLSKSGKTVTVADNGRGIPVDPHPKFP